MYIEMYTTNSFHISLYTLPFHLQTKTETVRTKNVLNRSIKICQKPEHGKEVSGEMFVGFLLGHHLDGLCR